MQYLFPSQANHLNGKTVMCYGIYDKKSETLIFSNLPGETSYAIIGELLAGSTDKDRYEILVLAVDDTYRSVSNGRMVIVRRAL